QETSPVGAVPCALEPLDEFENDEDDQRASLPVDPSPVEDLPVRRNPPRDWAAPPPWATGSGTSGGRRGEPRPAGDPSRPPEFLAGRADEGRGLAGSAADRLASGAAGSDAGAAASVAGAAGSGASGGPATAGHDAL